jgi:hypothetical protein
MAWNQHEPARDGDADSNHRLDVIGRGEFGRIFAEVKE